MGIKGRTEPQFSKRHDTLNLLRKHLSSERELLQAKEALEQKTIELELLNETGTMLVSTLDLQKILQAVTDAGTRLINAQFGAFFYTGQDESGGNFELYTLSGAPREAFERFGRPRATPLFAPTFEGKGPIRSANVQNDPRYGKMGPHFGMPKGHLPVCSYLAVPVVTRGGEVVGGLFFGHSDEGVFSARSERLIVGIASQAAIAIENARLYDTVKRAAEERKHLLDAEREARSEAERISVMKDEFLATLSHELRTPLNAILGWSQLLLDGKEDRSNLEFGLKAIARNAKAQTQLIEDLLDMSRIISGRIFINTEQVDLHYVIDAAIASIRPAVNAKNIQLITSFQSQSATIYGDPIRLQQIVWNLLSNAVKFTPERGQIEIRLESTQTHATISVIDSGIGISADFIPKVFERFRQADSSSTRKHGGLGIGLSIVKQLVELHGGQIIAESAGENKGTSFTVTLPTTATSHRETDHSQMSLIGNIDLENISVLVVDDASDARELIRRILEKNHATVTTADSADTALELLKKVHPDVLISDIGMPNKDGYQLLQEVRSLPTEAGGKTPAIALTAFARSEDRSRAMLSGFQIHLSKPLDPHKLIAVVAGLAHHLGEHQQKPRGLAH